MITKTKSATLLTASLWVAIGHGMSQVIRLGSNMIMTRLLVPEMFGVMAIANTLIIGVAIFSDLGISQNIINNTNLFVIVTVI